MKRVITSVAGIMMIVCLASAQRTVYHSEPEKLFNQGKEMFGSGNYTGAQDLLRLFIAKGASGTLLEEAEYMVAAAAFHRGENGSAELLEAFLSRNPESVHRHRICFFIGSSYFDKDQWAEARNWLYNSDIDYLTSGEQEDHSFRMAYSNLMLNNKDEAYRLFGLLSRNSNKYRDAGIFYTGYIDYTSGRYEEALSRFDRIRNNSEYAADVAFYTLQATFLRNRLEDAIRLGETYISNYPNSEHTTEVYRVLGSSNYRLGYINKAIPYYERYFRSTDAPLRSDAYFMGLSYAETGKYDEAIRMFQMATGENDALNQNAQMQLGQMYLKLGDKQRAQMSFDAAARYDFDMKVKETSMFNSALLAHETNLSVFGGSIILFENFLKQFPNSPHTDQVNDILAETFLTSKDYSAALSAIDRIKNPGRRILEAKQMVLFQLGAQQFVNGDMTRAIQYFDRSIDLGSYDRNARSNSFFWRGESRYRLGNYGAAANDFSQFVQSASQSDGNYAAGWYNLGYARFKQNQYTAARDAFIRYISVETNKSKPEYADAHNRIGDGHYYNRNFADAERYYSAAANINPAAADYSAYQKAFVMGLQRNYRGKIDALDDLMRRFPNSQYFDDALYEKSRAMVMLNLDSEAIATLRKLIADYPRSPLTAQAGVQLGQLYYNGGQYQQAITAYKNVIANFGGSDEARAALVSLETVYRDINDIQSYVAYANSLPGGMRIAPSRQDSLTYLAAEGVYMRGSKAEAGTAMQRYLQSFPNGAYSGDANYYLGVIADERGDKQQALAHFRNVIDSNNAKFMDNALIYTAGTEYNVGNYRQALADYSRLASSARSVANQQTGQMGVARSHYALGSFFDAANAATTLLQGNNLSPETVTEAHYIRGKAYMNAGETDRALADLQVVGKDTRNAFGAEAQFLIAENYYNRKAYDRAEAQVKQFMEQGTPHQYWMARALIILSDTYKAKGDDFQAKQYIESLKANYKGNEEDIRNMINERLR